MLTKLAIRNFKRFDDVEIPLANPVVFVGPNNSGKSTALQALALWELGLRRWKEKRSERDTPAKRPGVAINRRDVLSVPMPAANLLWRSLRTRYKSNQGGTQNVRIDIVVEGYTTGETWCCGLEFDYTNEESFVCRPLRLSDNKPPGTDRARQHQDRCH